MGILWCSVVARNEDNVGRRFFKRLQESVKRLLRKHVRFIDNVDFEGARGGDEALCSHATRGWDQSLGLEAASNSMTSKDLPCVISAQNSHSLQGSTGLSGLDSASESRFAQFTAFAKRRATVVLPVPLGPQKKIGMTDSIQANLVLQRFDDVLLPHHLVKGTGDAISARLPHKTWLHSSTTEQSTERTVPVGAHCAPASRSPRKR